MSGGDLRPPPPGSQRAQRLLEGQPRLPRVPAAREPCGHRLAPRHFRAEAFEAQRARTLGHRVVVFGSESISRFLRPAACTERLCVRPGRARGRRRPSMVERELVTMLLFTLHYRTVPHRSAPPMPQLYGTGVTD